MAAKRVIVYPYAMSSMSGKELAQSFDRGLRVYPDRTYRPSPNHLVINWGSGRVPNWMRGYAKDLPILNHPAAVNHSSNKLRAFNIMGESGVEIPRFTEDVHEAYEWDCAVVARKLLRSHSGRGAHFVARDDRQLLLGSLSNCPLYTEYVKKEREFRVHVFNGEVIDVQQKKVRNGSTENNFQIRSYDNGWVFCRNDVDLPDSCRSNSILAVQSLGLDFGAVDVIWNNHRGKAYVLEVNTAPGLHGSTTASYVEAITKLFGED